MKKFNIFSVVLQKLNRTPLLYLNTTFSEGNLQGFSASLNGVNHGLPSIYHALTFDSLACRLRVLPSRGVQIAAMLCLLLTLGVGNAWGAKYSMTPDQTSTGSSSSKYIESLTGFTYASPAGSKIKWQMNYWNPKSLQIKTNQSTAANEFRFYTDSVLPGKVTKVVISFAALTVSDETKLMFLGGTSKQTGTSGGTAGTWNSTAKTLTWTPGSSDNYTYFAFYQNGKAASGTNNLASSDAIVVTYLTKVTLDKNTGTADGVAYFDDNAAGASTATGYTFSAATHGSKTCTGYYTASSSGTKVLNADGSFAATNVSGYITSSKWTYAGGTLTLYAQWASAGPACSDPNAPTKGSVNVSSVQISTSSDAANYDVYYSTSATAPTGSTTPTDTLKNRNSKTFTGLAYGTTYYYWLRANCGSNQSNWIAGSPTTFTTSAPKPTSVSAGLLKPTQATFTITDSNSPASYDIYCSTSSTAPNAETTPSATGITGTSYTKTGLSAGTTYYYWVRGVGPNAKSDWLAGSGTTFTTPTLSSISVSTGPTKTTYLAGETFNPAGLVIQRNYSNSTNDTYTYADHTAEFTFSPSTATALTSSNDKVTITYGGKTVDQAITVYAVTLQAKAKTLAGDTPEAIAVGGPGAPTFTASTRAISPASDAGNYVFWQWEISGATLGSSATTKSNTITNPSGAVTLTAIYHKPITITWLKGGTPYETGSPTTKIGYNKQWKDLTPPTDPGDATLGSCANKFMGWSNSMAVDWVKEDNHTAPATLIKNAGFSGNTTAITSDITFRAVYATASIGATTTYTSTFTIKQSSGPGSPWTDSSHGNAKWTYSGLTFANDANAGMPNSSSLAVELPSGSVAKSYSVTGTSNAWSTSKVTVTVTGAGLADAITTFNDKGASYDFTASNKNAGTYTFSCTTTGGKVAYIDHIDFEFDHTPATYSDYVTVCCAQHDITLASSGSVSGGTFNAGGTASACEGAKVTLSATPSDGYVFAGWTVTKTASPYTDITSTNVEVDTLTMPDYAVTVTASFATVSSISVKTAPTKATYCSGEYFDPTGLELTANYSNSTSGTVAYSGNEAKFTFSPGLSTGLTTGNTSVSITYGGKTTSQAITVNALRTITKTGSGTVTGGTFTVDNASACVGATITIGAEAASHYTFSSWRITKTSDGSDVTGSVSIGSSSTASTSFTMPDYNVTVTPTFTEGAYKTVIFMNNNVKLYSGDGFDATNKWKQKVYIGESPVTPTKLTDGYGSGDACNSTSTLFYGWTRRTWDDDIDDESDIKALTGVETVYKSSLPAITAETTDTIYHAVWAAGEAVEPTLPTIIAYWAPTSFDGTNGVSATTGTGTLTSNVSLSSSGNRTFQSTISKAAVMSITGIDISDYDHVRLSFWARGSAGGTISITTNLSATPIATTSALTGAEVLYVVDNVPKTATSITLTYSASSGSFFFGTVKLVDINTSDTYSFTELTSSNTSGWSTSDWDGYYLITNTQASLKALDGNAIGATSYISVSPSDGVITNGILNAFKIEYNSTEEKYTVKGIGENVYLASASNSISYASSLGNTSYHSTIDYNQINNSNSSVLSWNTSGSKFGFYGSKQTSWPTLYKILASYSTFRTTCCEKHDVNLAGVTPGTVTGGTFSSDPEEACEGSTITLNHLTTTTGYNISGWTVTGDETDDEIDVTGDGDGATFTMPDEAVTVTAVFAAAHTTTVTLDMQGGSSGTGSVTATVNLDMPSATMPTRSGYTFGGYYSATSGSGTQYYAADGSSAHVWDDGESATATLYAKWTASGYTVTLNNASATTAGTASVSVNYGANTNLTSAIEVPTKNNNVFGGYYTGESGTGTRLIDQDGNWLPSVASYTDVNRNWLYANDLTLHAKWTAVSYTNYRTTCGPEITVSEEAVYLTSYPGCEVLTTGTITVSSTNWGSTVGAPKFLSFKVKDMVTGTTYSHTNSTISNAANEVRVYNSAGNGGSSADGGYIALPTDGTNPSYNVRIAYTPTTSVYNTRDHYTIIVEVYDNSSPQKKALTMETVDLYGRTLPEQFVIATKKDGKWWALPNDLASDAATAKATKAIEIAVDNETTPTAALLAPENTLYKATGYYTGPSVANRNRSGIRFTRNGSQYLQVSSTEATNVMWLSSSGGTDVQDWYLDGGTAFANYTIKLDPRIGTGGYKDKKMGMYGSNFGFYSSPTAYEIYFLPVESSIEEAEVVEWGKNSIVVEVDAQGMSEPDATKVIGRIGSTATAQINLTETKTSVKGGNTKYNYTVNFGNTFDLTTKKGDKLYLDWLNSSGTVVGTSMISIPWIIDGTKTMSSDIDAVKGHWTSAEVHVLPGAVLTANAGSFDGSAVTIGQLEIYPGATVKVTTGTLTASNLILRNGWTRAGTKKYDVARLYIATSANLSHTNAYLDWYIDYDQYYPIAVPWPVATNDIYYKNTKQTAPAGVTIRHYDGSIRAGGGAIGNSWVAYTWGVGGTMPDSIVPSKGYAMTAKRPSGKAFSIVRMPMMFGNTWTTGGEQDVVSSVHKNQVSVTAHGIDDDSKPWYAKGWNFIANPFMSAYNGNDDAITGKLLKQGEGNIKYATIPDENFKDFNQVDITSVEGGLKPSSGFFVQVDKDGENSTYTLTFSKGKIITPSAPARYTNKQEAIPEQEAYIRLSSENCRDQMGLIIGSDYTADYEMNADLSKILGEANTLKTYMRYTDMDMAYLAINEQLAREFIPVTVNIPIEGEYTYSLMNCSTVDDLEGLYLIDYQTGQTTNLLFDDYTFTIEAGTFGNRFAINAIVGDHKVPTGADVTGLDKNSTEPIKFIWHDNVYILHQNVIYDSTGKRVNVINK